MLACSPASCAHRAFTQDDSMLKAISVLDTVLSVFAGKPSAFATLRCRHGINRHQLSSSTKDICNRYWYSS